MKLKALLFDLDGTLINSIPLITWSFQKTFEYFGLPWRNGEVLKTIGIPLREVAERYMPGRAGEFIEKYTLFQREKHMNYIKPYPGTAETMEFIKNCGYCTAVVTSKRKSPALKDLEITGLDKYFDITVAVEDVSRPKPDPEPVLKALALLNIKPGNALFVGDSWYDIMSGRQAGVATVGVTWGMASRGELVEKKAQLVVDSWQELINHLKLIKKAN
ncbi:MAG: HAD-IA family hydrolase [Bacillota bacterium]